MVVPRSISIERCLIWKSTKKTKGQIKARSAASQIGMIFFRRG